VGALIICVLVFTVFYIVCTVFLYCFVYVYLFEFVLILPVYGLRPPSDNSIAVRSSSSSSSNNNNNNNNNNSACVIKIIHKITVFSRGLLKFYE
jgi:hypothetical protein